MKHLIGVSSNRSIGITTDGDAQVHIELILGIEGGISYKLDGTTVRGEVTTERILMTRNGLIQLIDLLNKEVADTAVMQKVADGYTAEFNKTTKKKAK